MHIYLRLVIESGDPSVEQVLRRVFHSVEVGSEGCDISGISDNPDIADKPRSVPPVPCALQILFTCLMFVVLSTIGMDWLPTAALPALIT